MSIITAGQVKGQLGGLREYIEASAGEWATDLYADCIQATEDEWETNTRILLSPKTVAMMPMPGEEYDILDAAVNFHRAGRQILPRFAVRWLPVRSIIRVRFALAANDPIIDYPQDWIKANLRLGKINLLPYLVAAPAMSSTSATMLNMFTAGALGADGWPHLIDCMYTAGYDALPTEEDPTPAALWPLKGQLKLNLAKDAAWRVAGACRRDIPDSVSLDGFSQRFLSVDKYLADMNKEFLSFQQKYMRQERPVNMGIL